MVKQAETSRKAPYCKPRLAVGPRLGAIAAFVTPVSGRPVD